MFAKKSCCEDCTVGVSYKKANVLESGCLKPMIGISNEFQTWIYFNMLFKGFPSIHSWWFLVDLNLIVSVKRLASIVSTVTPVIRWKELD